MKDPKSFRFPASFVDPEKILNCLTDDQQNALTEYVGAGIGAYYSDMMKELTRAEGELARARRIISQQKKVLNEILQRSLFIKLPGDFGPMASIN